MTVHWTINGIAACRSPLTSIVATSCAHKDHNDPDLLKDIDKLKKAWPNLELDIQVVDGSCDQRVPDCHCDADFDCGCSSWVDPVDDEEYDRQVKLLNERER